MASPNALPQQACKLMSTAGGFETWMQYVDGFGMINEGLHHRASRDWGGLIGFSREALEEINIHGIEFYRDFAREYASAETPMLVGGVIGPRGDAYNTGRMPDAAEAEDYHSEQILTFRRAGTDQVTAMTFSSVEEAISRIDSATGNAPEYYMINCTHPTEFEPGLAPGKWTARLGGFMPNAVAMETLDLCKLGHLEDGDPGELGAQMAKLARRFPHINVWGGCCGTDGRHIGQITRQVSAVRVDSATGGER